MQHNPIQSEVNFDQDGKQVGFLRLPHSVHRSAYGWIPIPVASIKNGQGPTVLIMAGNHGDEYEGQVLVAELIRQLEPEQVQGQIILLPLANTPAAQAGLRTSPIDGGNLNRSFPGRPDGSPTEIMAHYIEHQLLARCDYLLDLHSGGSSLIYHGANMLVLEPRNAGEEQQVMALVRAFGLEYAFFMHPNPVTSSSAARRQGAISLVAELSGGGRISPHALAQARQGVLHFLGAQSLLHGPLVPQHPPAQPRIMRVNAPHHYLYARQSGIFEPLVTLGKEVRAGQLAARIHQPDQPWLAPAELYFEGPGLVICQRAMAPVQAGDCLFQLAQD